MNGLIGGGKLHIEEDKEIVIAQQDEVSQTNRIMPGAIVHKAAQIGRGNVFFPGCYIGPTVIMGDANTFFPGAIIGCEAEHASFEGKLGNVHIGNKNRFREHVTVQASTDKTPGTKIGNECWLLTKSHVGHDCIIGDNVTLSCGAQVGGESIVMKRANFGLNASCHQRSVIGSWAMLGGHCFVSKKSIIRPGHVFMGIPARNIKMNTVLLEKLGITDEELNEEFKKWCLLRS